MASLPKPHDIEVAGDDASLHESCGVVGVYAPGLNVAQVAFYGLYASLLGHCGTKAHAKLLKSMIEDPEKRRGQRQNQDDQGRPLHFLFMTKFAVRGPWTTMS